VRTKRGAIPTELAPILERLSLTKDHWVDLIQNFGRYAAAQVYFDLETYPVDSGHRRPRVGGAVIDS